MNTKTVAQKNIDQAFIKLVLRHYESHGRHELIWRKKITAYKILVSEIMLQQTQVSRVIPKYKTWMKMYPTLEALSKSSLKDVLTIWQGLGYQRRAKALLSISSFTKKLPKTFDELVSLSGIGPYTASAIMAFAYDIWSKPLLETNIRTALIDYFHPGESSIHDGMLYDDLSRLEKYKKVKSVGARHWYYALMDYGAHLKVNRISHNSKSLHNNKQTAYKGSFRELRAKALFSITHGNDLPKDERIGDALTQLTKEGFIKKVGKRYSIL